MQAGVRPPTVTVPRSVPPEKWGTRPLTQRNRVDLPDPVGPTTSTSSPSGITKLASVNTALPVSSARAGLWGASASGS